MQTTSVAEIYEANRKIRLRMIETLSAITREQASALPDGEKWSIAQIADHVSIVNHGMYRICNKLLSKAKENGLRSAGPLDLSEFMAKAAGIVDVKLEAPEMVHPGANRPLAESLASLEESERAFEALRPAFEEFDPNAFKFPHPFFGEMSAAEWLMLAGGHEARHLSQIKKIIGKLEATRLGNS